jgi:hypothetical protein
LELAFGGQGKGAGIAALEADFATRKAARGMGHERSAGFRVPFKDVVRAEVEALEVREADVVIDAGKPQEFFAEMAE